METLGITTNNFHTMRQRGAWHNAVACSSRTKISAPFRQHMSQSNVLARKFVPRQVRLFDEEYFLLMPAGYFDAVTIHTGDGLRATQHLSRDAELVTDRSEQKPIGIVEVNASTQNRYRNP